MLHPKLFGVFAALLVPALALPMHSDENHRTPVLIELFTSEGCSSCPSADRLLETLDRQQPFPNVDLIVLSEHVDYWNNGGWQDSYSSPLLTARQQKYAAHFNLDSVYTPQRVIDGSWEGVGSNAASIKADVAKAMEARKIDLQLSGIAREGRQLKFHVTSGELGSHATNATLYIALADDKDESSVRRGENAGRTLTHVAVVRSLLAESSVKSGHEVSKDFSLQLPGSSTLASGARLVAFLQVDSTQKIIGVTQGRLP